MLDTIIQTYLINQSYCIVFISNNDFNFNLMMPLITIKSTSDLKNQTTKNYYNDFDKLILKSLDSGCDTFIIYNSKVKDFLKSFDLNVQITDQKNHHRRFIFIFNEIDINMTVINDILTSHVIKYIPDFIIIYPDSLISNVSNKKSSFNKPYELFNVQTYKIITREMDDPEMVLVDYWFTNNQSFLYNANLFAYKIKNLIKMPLNLSSTHTFPPYVIIEGKF